MRAAEIRTRLQLKIKAAAPHIANVNINYIRRNVLRFGAFYVIFIRRRGFVANICSYIVLIQIRALAEVPRHNEYRNGSLEWKRLSFC